MKFSASLAIRETQVKNELLIHMWVLYTHIKTSSVGENVKVEPLHILGWKERECSIYRVAYESPEKNLKIELPYGPEIPLLSTYLKELKLESRRDVCKIMFITALFTIAKR